ncbi:acyl-CoA N-acyltransferase [Mycena amicta]|nr:acyl-CoA N-acyltransferase [Mycena amicta]
MDALHPLERNTTTNEPFLRLLSHPNIILTPPRLVDAPAIVRILNDERVYPWLKATPFPYTLADAEWWLGVRKAETDQQIAQLESETTEKLKKVDFCPVRILHEVRDDGTEVYLGDITIRRADQDERRLLGATTDEQEIWAIADFLAPTHHRQGIMTDAIGTLLTKWAVPRMGVRWVVVTPLVGNEGSVRVFEKNGFRLVRTVDRALEARGVVHSANVLEWKLEDQSR